MLKSCLLLTLLVAPVLAGERYPENAGICKWGRHGNPRGEMNCRETLGGGLHCHDKEKCSATHRGGVENIWDCPDEDVALRAGNLCPGKFPSYNGGYPMNKLHWDAESEYYECESAESGDYCARWLSLEDGVDEWEAGTCQCTESRAVPAPCANPDPTTGGCPITAPAPSPTRHRRLTGSCTGPTGCAALETQSLCLHSPATGCTWDSTTPTPVTTPAADVCATTANACNCKGGSEPWSAVCATRTTQTACDALHSTCAWGDGTADGAPATDGSSSGGSSYCHRWRCDQIEVDKCKDRNGNGYGAGDTRISYRSSRWRNSWHWGNHGYSYSRWQSRYHGTTNWLASTFPGFTSTDGTTAGSRRGWWDHFPYQCWCCSDNGCHVCGPEVEQEHSDCYCTSINAQGKCVTWHCTETDDSGHADQEDEDYTATVQTLQGVVDGWVGDIDSRGEFEFSRCTCETYGGTVACAAEGGCTPDSEDAKYCARWSCDEKGMGYFFPNLAWPLLWWFITLPPAFAIIGTNEAGGCGICMALFWMFIWHLLFVWLSGMAGMLIYWSPIVVCCGLPLCCVAMKGSSSSSGKTFELSKW